jgi:hypothetical protein
MNTRCNGIAALLFDNPEFETARLSIDGAPSLPQQWVFVEYFLGGFQLSDAQLVVLSS